MDLKDLARRGAEARLNELQAERQAILRAFPDLQKRSTNGEAPRRKRRLSAAGRKAISEAAKRRWAKLKAAKKA